MNIDSCLVLYEKKSRWIRDTNVEAKTVMFLEENKKIFMTLV